MLFFVSYAMGKNISLLAMLPFSAMELKFSYHVIIIHLHILSYILLVELVMSL